MLELSTFLLLCPSIQSSLLLPVTTCNAIKICSGTFSNLVIWLPLLIYCWFFFNGLKPSFIFSIAHHILSSHQIIMWQIAIFCIRIRIVYFHCKSTFTVKKKYLWLCQCFIAQCCLIYVKKSSLTFNLYPIRLKLSQSYFILLFLSHTLVNKFYQKRIFSCPLFLWYNTAKDIPGISTPALQLYSVAFGWQA